MQQKPNFVHVVPAAAGVFVDGHRVIAWRIETALVNGRYESKPYPVFQYAEGGAK